MKTRLPALIFLRIALLAIGIDLFDGASILAEDKIAPTPVESDMHEFMEYVFQPPYKRLRQAMAEESKDSGVWKSIKSDSLILAEAGNLLLIRVSKDQADEWAKHSAQVRALAADLYRAAKQKDATAAQKSYRAMLVQCNHCHDHFADGEHQLTP
ncbi:MAG: cytochrome c [Planctomycetales bacterium]|nr:cytochrome c [Planctomycetales bacterium]